MEGNKIDLLNLSGIQTPLSQYLLITVTIFSAFHGPFENYYKTNFGLLSLLINLTKTLGRKM